ncbi:MAG TPA: DUF1761 domain-containing protein [Burkholderiales bacterium]|nr:DUF1761 domain-containing protein [Burkholderiales bacterium]
MQEFPINWLALFAAALVRMIVGVLWYAPFAFGPPWMRLVGCAPEEMKARMPKAVAVDAIGSLVMAFVLVHAVHYAGAAAAGQGAAVGFFNWLGFVGVTTLAASVYEKRPLKLFFINNGFQLVSLLLMGAIVAVWT